MSNLKKKDSEIPWEYYNINIQCPDCGTLLTMNENRELFCTKCDRVFSEAEVRNRCVL